MTTTRRPIRRLGAATAVAVAVASLAACGDDGETASADDEPATSTEATNSSFCDGILGIEQAFAEAPEDPSELEAFVEERIEPNLALIDGNEPEEIAEEVRVMTGAVEQVASTGDFSAFETPEFSAASETVYSSLDDACGFGEVEFEAVDYGYEGIPDTLPAGPTAFVMTNASEAGEPHEIGFVKLRDGVDLSVDELLSMSPEESEQYIETMSGAAFAPPGATGGTIVELTPGRWVYACFIPVGSSEEGEGSGPPHFVEGMAGEFTVE